MRVLLTVFGLITAQSFGDALEKEGTMIYEDNTSSSIANSITLPHEILSELSVLPRWLAEEPTHIPTPEEACNTYNSNENFNKLMACECANYQGTQQIQVACKYHNQTCNSDNSWCGWQTVDFILTEKAKRKQVTTCIDLTTSDSPSNTCVQIDPTVPDIFSTSSDLQSCSAMMNGQACDSCDICKGNDGTAAVTINCVNVNSMAYATCNQVVNGAVLAQWDQLSSSQFTSGVGGMGSMARIVVSTIMAASLTSWHLF